MKNAPIRSAIVIMILLTVCGRVSSEPTKKPLPSPPAGYQWQRIDALSDKRECAVAAGFLAEDGEGFGVFHERR